MTVTFPGHHLLSSHDSSGCYNKLKGGRHRLTYRKPGDFAECIGRNFSKLLIFDFNVRDMIWWWTLVGNWWSMPLLQGFIYYSPSAERFPDLIFQEGENLDFYGNSLHFKVGIKLKQIKYSHIKYSWNSDLSVAHKFVPSVLKSPPVADFSY